MLRRKLVLAITLFIASPAFASVIEFTDKAQWEAAAGSFTTLDFVLPPSGTPLNDQYADQGVNLEGFLWSHHSDAYVNDEWGLRSASGGGGAWAHFDTPQQWVAVDFPGSIRFELFRNGESIYLSTFFFPSGTGNFAGLVSSELFDEVHLHKVIQPEFDSIFIDDLHFGTSIPAPGALGLIAIAGVITRRSRYETIACRRDERRGAWNNGDAVRG